MRYGAVAAGRTPPYVPGRMSTYVRAGRRAMALLEVGKLYGPHFFLQYRRIRMRRKER